MAGSSSSSPTDIAVSLAIAPPLSLSTTAQTPTPPRRLAAPCWTHDETLALLDSYRDKWYSLRRGNLRANDWQDVAADVLRRCPPLPSNPPKTPVQCRHKIEKLRKRFRAERQKALHLDALRRPASPWLYFSKMEAMDQGSNNPSPNPNVVPLPLLEHNNGCSFFAPATAPASHLLHHQMQMQMQMQSSMGARPAASSSEEEDEEEENCGSGDEAEESHLHHRGVGGGGGGGSAGNLNIRSIHNLMMGNGEVRSVHGLMMGNGGSSGGGIRFAVPAGAGAGAGRGKVLGTGAELGGGLYRGGGGGVPEVEEVRRRVVDKRRRRRERETEAMGEMAAAVRMLGDGFLRMEQRKMEMAREMEKVRMEMELKRTEMILDSQRRIVDAFVKGFMGRKKAKVSPEN